MRSIDLSGSAFHRVVVAAAVTCLVMLALFAVKSYSSSAAETLGIGRVDVKKPVPNGAQKAEETSFVASPTIETNPKFFFGAGDGSNGYYAERPRP
jgi:hypothetical protein